MLVPGSTAYVCGSAGFADSATELLTAAGAPPGDIRVERFGPTG
jgi:ferredoxin-NADP reductase